MRSIFSRAAPLAFGLFVLACAARAQETPAPARQPAAGDKTVGKDESEYRRLVERVKGGDASVDFARLRSAFGEWLDDEKSRTDAPNRAAMVEAFNKKDYAKAVELVEMVLDYEFIHRGLHLAAEAAYRQLGNVPKADFHRDVARKLLEALLGTGDGKSPETAYKVLNIDEEYAIMRELGVKVTSQSLMTVKEVPYDLLSGKDKDGKEVGAYFDISYFFGGGRKAKK